MKLVEWIFIAGAWLVVLCLGIYAVDGISRGSQGWIAGMLIALAWILHSTQNKLDEYKRRIERLESELGKHQRAHGHLTQFHE